MLTSVRAAARIAFWRIILGDDGSVLPIFVLSLIPVLGLIGAVTDYTRVSNVQSSLQISLDAALLAGAQDGSTNWTNVALNSFNANVQATGAVIATPTFVTTANRAYTGSVTATVPVTIGRLLGISSINVGAQGTATATSRSGSYYCVMALNRNAPAALQLTGNASIQITAPKCVVQVNSKNLSAVTMNGNTTINSQENCFVGGLQKVGNSTIAPPPDSTCKAIPDPFANYPRPAVGPCNFTNYQLSGNNAATLQPGVYCGGMNFSGPVAVKFAPGLYVIKDGTITETGGTFTGIGVSFFLTGSGTSMQMSGQANWHIVAPTAGASGMPGFAIFLDPNGPSGIPANSSQLSGQAELYFEGIVYLPGQAVSVTGNGQLYAPSPYTSYIADTLSFVGNAELIINNDTSLTSVPIPTALYVQTNGILAKTQ
jgi:putative Flp pilus-assembly TadE/G-like protein